MRVLVAWQYVGIPAAFSFLLFGSTPSHAQHQQLLPPDCGGAETYGVGDRYPCDDNEICTDDSCVDGVCEHYNHERICKNDNNECVVWRCSGGDCLPRYRNGQGCDDDGNICTKNICSGSVCTPFPLNGGACYENDPCTENGRCLGGACVGTPDPSCEWPSCPEDFLVDGEGGDEHVPVTGVTRLFLSGARCRRVRVYYFTREWPQWTGQPSVFNDALSFEVRTSWGPVFSGSTNVNLLHDQFTLGPYPGGNYEVLDKILSNNANSSGDAWIDLRGMATNVSDDQLGSGVAFSLECCKVVSLLWERGSPDNAPLDSCPNNAGKRVFPGKQAPDDASPATRRLVDLVATVDPPMAGVRVDFRVWDVDDPFDQDNAAMADVAIIDGDTSGPDNRPPGALDPAVGGEFGVTDATGEARVTITVSMQPGNNYRAGASLSSTALNQTSQTTVDGLNANGGNWSDESDGVYWSKMLTVWRKLHVETDTMVRPTFAQNTFTMDWNEPVVGSVSTQVDIDVDDPLGGFQTDDQQFDEGYIEVQDQFMNVILGERIVLYTESFFGDDVVTINVADCGGGQSGLACLGGVTSGTAVLSDDDFSVEATFTAKTWGCDDAYSGPVASLAPPDLSALQLRYHLAYVDPVQDLGSSEVQGLVTFLRNQGFEGVGSNNGKALWDQAKAARNLPISTSSFWTVMFVSAWQAEEAEDGDPNSEDQVGIGITKGINTHASGSTTAIFQLGSTYTGLASVFKAVFGEIGFTGREKYTVAHEIGHTLGLPHNNQPRDAQGSLIPVGLMDETGDGHLLPFTSENLKRLREYSKP